MRIYETRMSDETDSIRRYIHVSKEYSIPPNVPVILTATPSDSSEERWCKTVMTRSTGRGACRIHIPKSWEFRLGVQYLFEIQTPEDGDDD